MKKKFTKQRTTRLPPVDFGVRAESLERRGFLCVRLAVLSLINKITEANAGGQHPLLTRTRWAARVAQFSRSAASESRIGELRLGVFAPLRLTGVDFNAETQR